MNAVGSPDNVVLAGKNQPPLAPIIANLVLECALTLQALLRQNLLLPIIPKQIRSSALTQTNSVSRNLPRLVLNTCLSDEGSQLASTPPPRELPDRETGFRHGRRDRKRTRKRPSGNARATGGSRQGAKNRFDPHPATTLVVRSGDDRKAIKITYDTVHRPPDLIIESISRAPRPVKNERGPASRATIVRHPTRNTSKARRRKIRIRTPTERAQS
jgi:hypothetical protein